MHYARRVRKSPLLLAAALFATAQSSRAGELDPSGSYLFAPESIATQGFAAEPERYVPDDADVACLDPEYTLVSSDTALEGAAYARIVTPLQCGERFVVSLPAVQDSYRASVWIRHGSVVASFVALPSDESGLPLTSARMAPTGRTTSDGWVELASNEMPVDGANLKVAYIKLVGFADLDGVDVDAIEVVRAGSYEAPRTCNGLQDPTCSKEGVCIDGQCVIGRFGVPPLPRGALKEAMVDSLAAKVRMFYGGKLSRTYYLDKALTSIDSMRGADSAFSFWNTWARAIGELHDWHTSPGGGPAPINGSTRRINACFIEGVADVSHGAWPPDPVYADILVSHVGANNPVGLKPGDRLLAVDGLHPIAWAQTLLGKDWGYHVATDPTIYADLVESLGGGGNSNILRYATTFTILRCDAATGTCSTTPETIAIADLPETTGQGTRCDNRPVYNLDPAAAPNPSTHAINSNIFVGSVLNTTPEEAIYGMIWDTLYGGGDPNGSVNSAIANAIADWKVNARGVILDHRAGNGGTLDTPTLVTSFVRPPEVVGVVRMPTPFGNWDGPADLAEGAALYSQSKSSSPYAIGGSGYDPTLPVALLLHRDGSASDFMPLGMKGAPNVRIFGPHGTAGAFSTFINFDYWTTISLQIASGDMILKDGSTQIGVGVLPDEIVAQKQSDLMAGKDTIFEAALTWLRANLK